MVLFLLKIQPVPGKREVLLEVLGSVRNHLEVKGGCLDCMILEERNADRAAIVYLERWDSREALNRHIRSNLYLRVLHAMDLAGEPPEISFFEVSEERGLELIEELRRD